jgi:hypothetical protein
MKFAPCVILWLAALAAAPAAMALEPGTASGELKIDDRVIEIRHVYAQRQSEGSSDKDDPTWTLLFSPEAIPLRKIDDLGLDPSLRIGLTRSSSFGDAPKLRVLSQNLYYAHRSVAGGQDPQLELVESAPGTFVGRLFLREPVDFFGTTVHYDISFSVTVMERNVRHW